jgi:hypothetical protein
MHAVQCHRNVTGGAQPADVCSARFCVHQLRDWIDEDSLLHSKLHRASVLHVEERECVRMGCCPFVAHTTLCTVAQCVVVAVAQFKVPAPRDPARV